MKKLFLSTLCLLSFSAMAQTQLTDSELQNLYKNCTYSGRISVHDPSIVVDTFTSKTTPVYYVYGSHLGRGKTDSSRNYRSWTTFRVVKRVRMPIIVSLLVLLVELSITRMLIRFMSSRR